MNFFGMQEKAEALISVCQVLETPNNLLNSFFSVQISHSSFFLQDYDQILLTSCTTYGALKPHEGAIDFNGC